MIQRNDLGIESPRDQLSGLPTTGLLARNNFRLARHSGIIPRDRRRLVTLPGVRVSPILAISVEPRRRLALARYQL